MEEYLKAKISRLEGEIERLKKRGYATHKRTTVDNYEYNSDVGFRTPFGKKEISMPMSGDELKASKSKYELDLYELESQLRQAQDELLRLEYNKPENIEKRQQEERMKNRKEQEQELREERLEHENKYEDLNKLVRYLELAGLDELSNRVSQLRFAFQKSKSDYISKEIYLQSKEKSFRTNTKTTKREYKEIKKNVVRLSKSATRNAKRYKDLYNLYLNAWKIVDDIEEKGISKLQGDSLCRALELYFTQPTGKYLVRDYGSYYSYKESENLGYQYLDFYRNSDSKYNEDVRRRRI